MGLYALLIYRISIKPIFSETVFFAKSNGNAGVGTKCKSFVRVGSVTANISKFYRLNDNGDRFHGESVLFIPRFDHKARRDSGWQSCICNIRRDPPSLLKTRLGRWHDDVGIIFLFLPLVLPKRHITHIYIKQSVKRTPSPILHTLPSFSCVVKLRGGSEGYVFSTYAW